MQENHENFLDYTSEIEPSQDILRLVFQRINLEKMRQRRTRIIANSFLFFVSCASFIPLFGYFKSRLAQTGFSQYFSLLFSDGGMIVAFWKEFSLSLLESLPIFGFVLLLAAILLSLFFLRKTILSFQKGPVILFPSLK